MNERMCEYYSEEHFISEELRPEELGFDFSAVILEFLKREKECRRLWLGKSNDVGRQRAFLSY